MCATTSSDSPAAFSRGNAGQQSADARAGMGHHVQEDGGQTVGPVSRPRRRFQAAGRALTIHQFAGRIAPSGGNLRQPGAVAVRSRSGRQSQACVSPADAPDPLLESARLSEKPPPWWLGAPIHPAFESGSEHQPNTRCTTPTTQPSRPAQRSNQKSSYPRVSTRESGIQRPTRGFASE